MHTFYYVMHCTPLAWLLNVFSAALVVAEGWFEGLEKAVSVQGITRKSPCRRTRAAIVFRVKLFSTFPGQFSLDFLIPVPGLGLQIDGGVAVFLAANGHAMRNSNSNIWLNRRAGRWAAMGGALVLLCLLLSADAQYGRRRFRYGGGYNDLSPARMREQELMTKAIDPAFSEDVFTFARLRFESDGGYGRGRVWNDDVPESDLNLIYRLFEATSLKVRPGLNFVDITTKDLAKHPFIYMAGAGRVSLHEDDASALRHYLLNGGFLMVDDFWGDEQWAHFAEQLKLIFPDRAPQLMDLTHPIFHNVYSFKKQPQIPSVGDFFSSGRSYDVEYPYEQMNHDPHYFGVYDDKHRLMMLICHNNHYGDGWEHEGDDETYFDLFSLPMGYPMLINVVTYAMTH